jgi:hypothetical protein
VPVNLGILVNVVFRNPVMPWSILMSEYSENNETPVVNVIEGR